MDAIEEIRIKRAGFGGIQIPCEGLIAREEWRSSRKAVKMSKWPKCEKAINDAVRIMQSCDRMLLKQVL